MDTRYLGRSGLKVSELCFGTMTFGREADEQTSYALLDRYVDAGGFFIDTANAYAYPGDGWAEGSLGSEQILGRWLERQRRDDFVIATKVRWPRGQGANDRGLSRRHILWALEESLTNLRTDYVDLYQVHAWDPGTSVEEVVTTLDGLVRSGKVRYLGVSNWAAWQIQKALGTSAARGLESFVSLQPLYNLLERGIEHEHVPLCLDAGLGILPWSPLRGGWLTGKYRREMSGPPPNTRVEDAGRYGWQETWEATANERTWRILDELFAIADELGKEPAAVAINWLLRRPGVTAPIMGARNLEQLESSLGATGWALEPEHVERLTAISDTAVPYPYMFLNDPSRLR